MSHREVSDRGFESQDSEDGEERSVVSQHSDTDSSGVKRNGNLKKNTLVKRSKPKFKSTKSDQNLHRHVPGSQSSDLRVNGMENRWSEGELYHSRSYQTKLNEFSQPSSISKSPSNSHIHYTRNSNSNSRPPHQYRYPLNRIVSTNQTYFPPPMFTRQCQCQCQCNNQKSFNKADSVISLCDDPETPEGLSWRRLHMSRAKLKATATTSELLSGFAMVAMVELQINQPTGVPEWLFVTFAVCTTILVSVHIFALMISTYLLPSIDAVSKLSVSSLVTESPHDRMKGFIELAWAFSTILGLLLFLVEIAILCWVKFWDYSFTAAMSATAIVIPILVLFIAFAVHFYHSLVINKCKQSVNNIQELENIKKQLDSPV